MPGVQKPHWLAPVAQKSSAQARRSASSSPSRVVTVTAGHPSCRGHARHPRRAVDEHRAAAALTLRAAPVLRGAQPEPVAQHAEQRRAVVGHRHRAAVDGEGDRRLGHPGSFPGRPVGAPPDTVSGRPRGRRRGARRRTRGPGIASTPCPDRPSPRPVALRAIRLGPQPPGPAGRRSGNAAARGLRFERLGRRQHRPRTDATKRMSMLAFFDASGDTGGFLTTGSPPARPLRAGRARRLAAQRHPRVARLHGSPRPTARPSSYRCPAATRACPARTTPSSSPRSTPATTRPVASFDGATVAAAFTVLKPAKDLTPRAGSAMPALATPTHAAPQGVSPICTRDPECPFHTTSLDRALTAGEAHALPRGHAEVLPGRHLRPGARRHGRRSTSTTATASP